MDEIFNLIQVALRFAVILYQGQFLLDMEAPT
jgi:hypothetical protein